MITPVPIMPAGTLGFPERCVGYWRDAKDPNDPTIRAAREVARHREHLAHIEAGGAPRYNAYDGLGGTMADYLRREIARAEADIAGQAALPWPGDHVDPEMPMDERERIASALGRGEVVTQWMGYSFDRLDPSNVTLGTCCLGRAGYRWPSGLNHYVLRYGLRLHPTFLAAIGATP